MIKADTPSVFCPKDCLTAKKGGDIVICPTCLHWDDRELPNYRITVKTGRTSTDGATVLGKNGTSLYVKEDRQTAVMGIQHNSPLIIR
jgi:hypothetical protein